jgi:uncharacterized protein YijF (DUF1287 family)
MEKSFMLFVLIIVGVLIFCVGLSFWRPRQPQSAMSSEDHSRTAVRPTPPRADDTESNARRILAGAKAQAAEGTIYTPGYFQLSYPDGDLPRNKGVCADVVVRSLRNAGSDLQRLIHEDMTRDFEAYPRKWGLSRPDSNIDHRRVPNQVCFFRRHGITLTNEANPQSAQQWQPGDFVYWKLDNGLDHCGVISDARNSAGLPLVVHNIGRCKEEDCLIRWRITGHFRYP